MMTRPIINLDDIELQPRHEMFTPKGDCAIRFGSTSGEVASLVGAQKLGYNITNVPPGKSAFPFHNHHINEEMFLILDGSGEIRIGNEVYKIKGNDLIACPPGGKENAHQIINTGEIDLKYLSVSTKLSPEIVEYPDSEKFAVIAELSPDKNDALEKFVYVGRKAESKDYWDGE